MYSVNEKINRTMKGEASASKSLYAARTGMVTYKLCPAFVIGDGTKKLSLIN